MRKERAYTKMIWLFNFLSDFEDAENARDGISCRKDLEGGE